MRKSSRRQFQRIGSGTSLCLRYRLPREATRLPVAPRLSREATQRLKILDYARTHSIAQTCRHFGIARSTYYRWQRRYDPDQLSSLENRPSRPRRCRRPSWTVEQVDAVRQARTCYPRWGKDKLVVVLRRQGWDLSVSMVGRILAALKRRGVLVEPLSARLRPHARHARPYAVRKPKAQAEGAPRDAAGGSGRARYHAPDPVAGGGAAPLQRRRCRFPLGRDRGPRAGHRRHGHRLPR